MQRRLRAHVHAHGLEFRVGAGRHRRDRRQRSRRNSRCWPNPARTPSLFSDGDDYAANIELAPRGGAVRAAPGPAAQLLAKVATPAHEDHRRASATFLASPPERCLKTLLVEGRDGGVVALVLRGDHELNAVKAQKLPEVASPLRMASVERRARGIGSEPGFVGPRGPAIARSMPIMRRCTWPTSSAAPTNPDLHLRGVNWGRDLPEPPAADLRNVVDGDPSPTRQGAAADRARHRGGAHFPAGPQVQRGHEGHGAGRIRARSVTMLMGCYGIGVTRIVAAAIEQNHDERGIIWPDPLAPVPCGTHSAQPAEVRSACARRRTRSMKHCGAAGIEVLYDDRDARPGVKFADAELLGIPHRLVLGERGIDAGSCEYRHRRASASQDVPLEAAVAFVKAQLAHLGAAARAAVRAGRLAARIAAGALVPPGPAAGSRTARRGAAGHPVDAAASATSTSRRSGTSSWSPGSVPT